jgi:predicted O-methyltransferase YrrM
MRSAAITKATRVFLERRILRATVREFFGLARAYGELRRIPEFDSNAKLLEYNLNVGGGVIRAIQVGREIIALLDELQALKPLRLLEVGTANGGTLFLLSRVAHPEACIVSVDLPGGQFGEGYGWWRVPVYRSFARAGQTIELLRGDSHSSKMLGRVREAFGNQPVDFVFIDGDHSYDGVRNDFELYGALVRKGGVVAFHDIANPYDAAIQVQRFWNEVKVRYRHRELISDVNQRGYGIGILYMN